MCDGHSIPVRHHRDRPVNTSPETDQIIGPWMTVLHELGDVMKDGEGHHGSYATINSVLNTIKPMLKANGLAVQQAAVSHDTGVTIQTRVWHESGQWIEDDGLRMPAPNDPQKVGGSVTYGRRYALVTFFALGATDDDGNGARQGIEDDAAELADMREREKKADSVWLKMRGLDDDGKQLLRSAVFDEFQIGTLTKSALAETWELLEYVAGKTNELRAAK